MNFESVRALKEELLQTTLESRRPSRRVQLRRSLPWGLESEELSPVGMGAKLASPGIALGIAKSEKNGYRLAVRVQDRRDLRGPAVETINDAAAGEIDLRYTGPTMPAAGGQWHRDRCDPIRAGASLGSQPQRTTGTLGCFVEPAGGGDLALLSAAHVLAGWDRGKPGDEIIQPGWDDRNGGDVPVAELSDAVKLGSPSLEDDDCAVAQLRPGVDADPVPGLAAAAAEADEPVRKDGRTTGHTEGRVLAVEVGPLEVPYPKLGRLRFDNLVEVDGQEDLPFAAQGDSGSVVLGAPPRALGLLFAVTGRGGRNGRGVSYLAPLPRVLQTSKSS